MENAKTIKDLLNAAPLSDGDYFAVSQPGVFNPIANAYGDTRRATAKELASFLASRADPAPGPYLAAAGKRQLRMKDGTAHKITVNGIDRYFIANGDTALNVDAILDAGAIAAGKDYYLFLAPDGDGAKFLLSLNKTAPGGFTAGAAKLIGGFHSLCADAGAGMTYAEGGEPKAHPLNGYAAGDILPASVWCLNHRPHSEPEGMVYISSLDFWCDIYLQSGSGANTKSEYHGAITRNRQYVDFVEDQFCVKKELLDDGEFAAAMLGSNEETAVSGANEAGATAGGAGGRVDTAGRRMLSIYGVEEGCGSFWQDLRTTASAGYEGAMYGQISVPGVDPLSYGPFWSLSGHSVVDSAGNHIMHPSPQLGGKGAFWYMCAILRAGGAWHAGAGCGSRARHAISARSSADASYGGRGRSRPARISI